MTLPLFGKLEIIRQTLEKEYRFAAKINDSKIWMNMEDECKF